MLNTNRLNGTKLTSDQYSWLEDELKNKTEKWTIVAMHNPMYSVGKWGSDPGKSAVAVALANQLNSLFVRYKVDVVLQGHDHMVSRTHPLNYDGAAVKENRKTINGTEYIEEPNGVIYIMNVLPEIKLAMRFTITMILCMRMLKDLSRVLGRNLKYLKICLP